MRRQLYRDLIVANQGLCLVTFSFLTNGASDPVASSFRGCGGLTGVDATAGNANSGPSVVSSITHSATGDFLVTLADNCRFVQAVHASIDDASDALIARVGSFLHEGEGGDNAVSFHVLTRAAATSTATDSTSRRVSVTAWLKISGNGA